VALPKVSLTACLLATVMSGSAATQTNITVDGSFSKGPVPFNNGVYSIGANLGKQVGGNLFHSFGKFGLTTGETAAFSGATTVNNIIGRVTGGVRSDIDGKIQSNIAGANLFLINPSGIVFGPKATVNVSGAFHASTADYIKMADGAKFQATHPDSSTLSAAAPAAFGFLTATPSNLTVNGSRFGVSAGQTLGLVAGGVSINPVPSPAAATGANLSAPAGTIHVTSVAGTGEVPVDPRNSSALTVTSFGPVNIKGGSTASTLNVSNSGVPGNGGSVFIRSGALMIDAGTINGDNFSSNPGGALVLRGDDQVTLTNSTAVAANRTIVSAIARGSGSGAEVTISTAAGGAISANANSLVQLGSADAGGAGGLSVSAGKLTLSNGAQFTNIAQGTGNGGQTVITSDSVLLDGGAALNPLTRIFSASSSTASNAGRGGPIKVVAGELSLHNGANVLAATTGAGAGGTLDVRLNGRLTVDSHASLATLALAAGNAGEVSVTVGGPVTIDMSIGLEEILNGISSFTQGSGRAGDVMVTAGALTINRSAEISSVTGASTGSAGKVTVNASTLSILSGGVIRSDTFADGSAGSVTVSVAGQLTIDRAMTPAIFTGISTQANLESTGEAGNIVVNAGSLALTNNGRISASTGGPGRAGSLSISAGALTISNNGAIMSITAASGDGGRVSVRVTGPLTIEGTSANTRLTGITAQSTGSGDAGSITVTAPRLLMSNNASISTEAQASTANGGNITLNVKDLVYLTSSKITTSVKGETGDGGNITIDPQLVILNHGRITAEAIEGHGGNITINADAFIRSADSVVSANSQRGTSGTVVNNGLVNINGALVVLSSELRGHAAVLREACAAYGDRPVSSLVEAGRGGLPQDPEATLPALYIADRDLNPDPQASAGEAEARIAPQQTTVRLTMHCG
jgi:filamentous hemagglutinin family protein